MWGAFADYWTWANGAKVMFDGERKLIVVNPSVSAISVKGDLYSTWKRWMRLYDYPKYPAALRTIGGDPIGPGLYAGDTYFLMNGWKVYVEGTVQVSGILYSDDGQNPWTGPGAVRATVSNLALSYGLTTEQASQQLDVQAKLAAIKLSTDDLAAETFGRWYLDFNTDTMTLYRPNGTMLKRFLLTRTGQTPPAYVERVPQ